jgi:hypothetical protein
LDGPLPKFVQVLLKNWDGCGAFGDANGRDNPTPATPV